MSGYDVDGHRNHDNYSFFSFHNPSSSDRSYSNKKILVMAVASLTMVIIVVLALHIYARVVLRRQARRRFAIHQLSLTVQAQAQAHEHNTGLDPNVIASLPTFIYKRKKREEEDEDGECAVCLSGVEDEQEVRLLPNCKHSFHVACIDTWLASHSTCPICRTKAEPIIGLQLQPHPPEPPILLHDDASTFEATSDNNNNSAIVGKNITGSSVSRFSSSFRRILSRDRSSSTRIQPSIVTHLDDHDLESQQ
ncbi:RING-H2 finger protein ATL40-like [Arachis duranensis]|uniref:RING-type E3 ubiquitin transferase n=1 Tax=Arachis duranensis TaxID=130453 RepID=A0A6P4B4W0_ARADU|nr:RING-H2 finger protein ATL40-like [Arachis duranensis]